MGMGANRMSMKQSFTDEQIASLTQEAVGMATLLRSFQRAMLEPDGVMGTHMLAAAFLLTNTAQECYVAGALVGDWQSAARATCETAIKIAEAIDEEQTAATSKDSE